jgi:dihydroneopterin aldolase/2-amino-4-hydroxy-6-hydroxymethyldihydropteridine diphosphokinase
VARIELTGVRVRGRHGVTARERAEAQPFVVDLAGRPAERPGAPRDDLASTVDYSLLCAVIADEVGRHSYRLIETLAEAIAERALGLGLAAVDVTVHKPEAPLAEEFADVAVTVHRTAEPPVRRAVVSLGSNLGDRAGWLQFGLTGLVTTPGVTFAAVSGVYETAPVGVAGQPDYLNAVLLVDTAWPAPDLLDRGQALEALAGRPRDRAGHAARTLDIDLIAVGDEVWETARLTLPHPRARQRAFVVLPWAEVDPAVEPAEFPGQAIRRRDDRLVVPEASAGSGAAGRDRLGLRQAQASTSSGCDKLSQPGVTWPGPS